MKKYKRTTEQNRKIYLNRLKRKDKELHVRESVGDMRKALNYELFGVYETKNHLSDRRPKKKKVMKEPMGVAGLRKHKLTGEETNGRFKWGSKYPINVI